MRYVVGVGDLRVTTDPNETIVTFALGSCLGVTMYDPVTRIGGLLHVMLPLSKADPDKARRSPAMYVDTGLELLMGKIWQNGGRRENMVVAVAGGARMKRIDDEDYFRIGQRNFTVLRKLLWKNGWMIDNQDVGGTLSRTMALRMSDGLVTINRKPIGDKQK